MEDRPEKKKKCPRKWQKRHRREAAILKDSA
jgi:hypothetical protein